MFHIFRISISCRKFENAASDSNISFETQVSHLKIFFSNSPYPITYYRIKFENCLSTLKNVPFCRLAIFPTSPIIFRPNYTSPPIAKRGITHNSRTISRIFVIFFLFDRKFTGDVPFSWDRNRPISKSCRNVEKTLSTFRQYRVLTNLTPLLKLLYSFPLFSLSTSINQKKDIFDMTIRSAQISF